GPFAEIAGDVVATGSGGERHVRGRTQGSDASCDEEFEEDAHRVRWRDMITTPDLIEALAANVAPVRRLRPPLARAAFWLSVAAAILVLLAVSHGARPDLPQRLQEPIFVAGMTASLLTGVLAAIAAFLVSLPDRSRCSSGWERSWAGNYSRGSRSTPLHTAGDRIRWTFSEEPSVRSSQLRRSPR